PPELRLRLTLVSRASRASCGRAAQLLARAMPTRTPRAPTTLPCSSRLVCVVPSPNGDEARVGLGVRRALARLSPAGMRATSLQGCIHGGSRQGPAHAQARPSPNAPILLPTALTRVGARSDEWEEGEDCGGGGGGVGGYAGGRADRGDSGAGARRGVCRACGAQNDCGGVRG